MAPSLTAGTSSKGRYNPYVTPHSMKSASEELLPKTKKPKFTPSTSNIEAGGFSSGSRKKEFKEKKIVEIERHKAMSLYKLKSHEIDNLVRIKIEEDPKNRRRTLEFFDLREVVALASKRIYASPPKKAPTTVRRKRVSAVRVPHAAPEAAVGTIKNSTHTKEGARTAFSFEAEWNEFSDDDDE